MGLIGSILGGVLGFTIGGPIGAVAGAALGHGLSERGMRVRSMNDQQQAQAAFFVSTFSMLAKLARADGRVSEEEIGLARTFMRDDLALDAEAERFAIKVFRAAKDSPAPFEEFAGQFAQLFRNEPQMRYAILDLLVRMALSDGELDPREREMLASASSILDIPLANFEHVLGRFADDFSRYYAVLDLPVDSSFDEVRRRYRQLVTEVHPDKVIAKGLPEEFVRYAQRRFQEVQEAYEAIRARQAA